MENHREAEQELKGQKGFIMMTAYLLMAALSVFSIALFTRGTNFLQSAERNSKSMAAFNMAEAGFDDMFYKIKNSTVTSFPYTGSYTSMDSGSVRGGYQVTVTDMGSNIKKIVVTGYSPAQSSSSESVASRVVTGYVQSTTSSAFNFGVFAKNSITLTGNATVDAYNSSSGAYGGSNVSNNGNLGTDSTTNSTVTLTGNATVNGSVTTGVGSTPSNVISTSGNAIITGSKIAETSVVNPQTQTTSIPSSGALNISGNTTITLAAGTYNYSSISITGNGQLNATGAVVIYVAGSISIAGNGISTSSSKPPNMLIYETGTSDVSLSGNGNLYAGIYAPNSAVSNTGNGMLYGAVTAKTYNQTGNGNVHFDQALQNVSGGSSGLSMLSWNESGLTNS